MDFARFLKAQESAFERALSELSAGTKTSHWMWFIFPQLGALGHSSLAKFYGVESLDGACRYVAHPVLGSRLIELTRIVLHHRRKSAHAIFGSPDDLKFCSSMTLFALAAPQNPEFRQAIEVFYGVPDEHTLDLLGAEWSPG